MIADTNSSSIDRVLTNCSKIPVYPGKPADLKPWLTSLLKKERIMKLAWIVYQDMGQRKGHAVKE